MGTNVDAVKSMYLMILRSKGVVVKCEDMINNKWNIDIAVSISSGKHTYHLWLAPHENGEYDWDYTVDKIKEYH